MAYRILSLSGGGVRGIFQSSFLSRVERRLPGRLKDHFDLIAGTSTGALVGLAVASGKTADEITRLYKERGEEIFRRRPLRALARGPRYDQRRLKEALDEIFGATLLEELSVEVLITASSVDDYSPYSFTREDEITVVDAALASAAAPTFFEAVTTTAYQRSFMDGGLWANTPLLVALNFALTKGHDLRDVRVLSVGTGYLPGGQSPNEVRGLRALSPGTFRFIYDFMAGTQRRFATRFASGLLPNGALISIDPPLDERIALDDAVRAREKLPGRAETEFDEHAEAITRLLEPDAIRDQVSPSKQIPAVLDRALRVANVRSFIPDRTWYSIVRGVDQSIDSYVASAQKTLVMISINLATGRTMDRIEERFEEMILRRENPVSITISLLDPDNSNLIHSAARVIDLPPKHLDENVRGALDSLAGFKTNLPETHRHLFEVRVHGVLPSASAILMDRHQPQGLIQLETKPYKAGMRKSWALEVGAGSEFFGTLAKAYEDLLKDGQSYPPSREN